VEFTKEGVMWGPGSDWVEYSQSRAARIFRASNGRLVNRCLSFAETMAGEEEYASYKEITLE
jgi:hypothetical protein